MNRSRHTDNTEASTNSVLAQKSGCSRPSGPTAKLPTPLFIQEFEVIILYSAFCNYRIDRGSEDESGWELPVCICLVLNSPGEREECRSDQLGNYLLTCWRLFSASARLSHTKSHARFWKHWVHFLTEWIGNIRRQLEILQRSSNMRSVLEVWFLKSSMAKTWLKTQE